MSFFSNFQSDKCPGAISGNPLNGMCEKVCIQAQKIFDACIKQIRLENYALALTDAVPASPTYPLTFISAKSLSSKGEITSLSVDRLSDKPGCARVQVTVDIPVEVLYTDAGGTDGSARSVISVKQDVLLYVPAPSIMPYKVTAQASAVCAEPCVAASSSEARSSGVTARVPSVRSPPGSSTAGGWPQRRRISSAAARSASRRASTPPLMSRGSRAAALSKLSFPFMWTIYSPAAGGRTLPLRPQANRAKILKKEHGGPRQWITFP